LVTNVCAKSNYDRLRIDKALGFRKSDNNKKKEQKAKEQHFFVAIWDHFCSKNLQ